MKRKDLEQTKRFRTQKGKLEDWFVFEWRWRGCLGLEQKVNGFEGHT